MGGFLDKSPGCCLNGIGSVDCTEGVPGQGTSGVLRRTCN